MLWVLPIFRSSTPVSDVFAMSLDPTLQPIDKNTCRFEGLRYIFNEKYKLKTVKFN